MRTDSFKNVNSSMAYLWNKRKKSIISLLLFLSFVLLSYIEIARYRMHKNQDEFLNIIEETIGKQRFFSLIEKPERSEKDPNEMDKYAKKISDIVDVLDYVKSNGKILHVTMINEAYLQLTHNWLCNTEVLNIHDQLLIIATDDATYTSLQKRWPNVNLFPLNTMNKLNEKYLYDTWKYKYYMFLRVRFLLQLLRNNIPFVLFETDSLWLRNPNELLENYSNYDIIAAQKGGNLKLGNYSAGYMFVNSTREAAEIWSEMTKRLKEGIHETYEQDLMDHLCKHEFASARCMLFPYKHVSDGIWYRMTPSERRALVPNPYIINNNYIVGINNKIARAKKLDQWFMDKFTICNVTHVHHVLESNGRSSLVCPYGSWSARCEPSL